MNNEWISVEDRLPETNNKRDDVPCLVFDKYWGIVVRHYSPYQACWNGEDNDYYTEAIGGEITHWMPLPNPPSPDGREIGVNDV